MQPLDPDLWRTLSPYLDEALDMASEQRERWLASLHEKDPGTAAHLRALLAEREAIEDSGFLEGVVQIAVRPATPSLSGQVLGAYRLLSLVEQGGMGSVWLAERCDGRFEGRAAVKLLNMAVMGRAGEERFKREGNILARLTHPNIARLTDAGVSPTGQPYLVLEYVDGQPIDRYCDSHALSIEARLRLFLDVLEAVAHAHANLVVHRDIKPANVLVSVAGRVTLLDFGIAKLLDDDEGGVEHSVRYGIADARPLGGHAGVCCAGAGRRGRDHHGHRRVRARSAAIRAAHRHSPRGRRYSHAGDADAGNRGGRAAAPLRHRRARGNGRRAGSTGRALRHDPGAIATRAAR
jgi:hypothetical protein